MRRGRKEGREKDGEEKLGKEEIERMLGGLKEKKAAGLNEIANEEWKHKGENIMGWV